MSGPLSRAEVGAALHGSAAARPAFVPLGQRLAAEVAQVEPEQLRTDAALLAGTLDGAQRLFGYDAIVVGFFADADPAVVAEAVRCLRAVREEIAIAAVVTAPERAEQRRDAVAAVRAAGEAGADAVLLQQWRPGGEEPPEGLKTLKRIAAFYEMSLVRSVCSEDRLDRCAVADPLAPGRALTDAEEADAPATVGRVVDLAGAAGARSLEAAWLTTAEDPAGIAPEDLHATVAQIAG